jgi:hypothetical protein
VCVLLKGVVWVVARTEMLFIACAPFFAFCFVVCPYIVILLLVNFKWGFEMSCKFNVESMGLRAHDG